MKIISDFMEASRIFAGVEGYFFIFRCLKFKSLLPHSSFSVIDFRGATQSRLIFIDETGKRCGEWSQSGLNYCLDRFDVVADRIAKWIQIAKKEVGIVGPLAAVVMISLSCKVSY